MDSYNEFSDRAEWEKLGLSHEGLEMEFFNQEDDYADSMRGEWYAVEDDCKRTDGIKVVYGGSFGNDHSPGASMYTWAEVYQADEHDAFYARVKELGSKPEYLESESEEDDTPGDETITNDSGWPFVLRVYGPDDSFSSYPFTLEAEADAASDAILISPAVQYTVLYDAQGKRQWWDTNR